MPGSKPGIFLALSVQITVDMQRCAFYVRVISKREQRK
jgi:hypothetical protein